MDGHEPQNVDAEFLQSRKFSLKGGNCSTVGVLAQIYFIDDSIPAPIGLFKIGIGTVGLSERRITFFTCSATRYDKCCRSGSQS